MFFFPSDRRRAANSERLLASALRKLDHMETRIMSTLDDIQAEADQIRDGVTTLIAKVNDEAAKIADLTAQLAAAGGGQAKVDAISAELSTVVGNLQAATTEAAPPEPGTVTG